MRWYVLHAEQYLKAFPGKRFAAHSAEGVACYLEEIGRIGGIWIGDLFRSAMLSVVLERAEVVQPLDRLDGTQHVMAALL